MNDDQSPDVPGGTPPNSGQRERATPAETPTRAPRKRHIGLKLAGIFVVIPALLFAAWTIIALSWSYSDGYRAGYIQKFSKKGWVCKTWEGDLAMSTIPGSAPEHFLFTVHSDSVAAQISKMMGSRVNLHYEEHAKVPGSCFGDTRYFVVGAQPIAGP